MREEIYAFNMERGSAFAVEMCGVSYCDGSYRIYRPESKIYVMEYIISGRGTVEENGRSAVASEGDVYFLRKGCRQYYCSDAKEPWVKIWFNFDGEIVDKICESYGISETVFHAPSLRSLFEEAVELGKSSRDYRLVSGGIAVIFLKIVQELAKLGRERDEGAGLAEVLKDYMDKTADFEESLDSIAEKMCCSKCHAIRAFRAVYGIAPYEYLQRRRYALSKTMLRNTAMNVTEVSERLGFYDVHYFTRAFKKRFEITPNKYKMNR